MDANEMTADDHKRLRAVVTVCVGKVMLSGYRNDLYDRELSGWVQREFDGPNNAAGGKAKRRMVECVWCNFD